MGGGRDDVAIAQALAAIAQVLAQSNEQAAIGLVVGMTEKLRSGGSIVSCETIRQRSREGLTRRELRHGCKAWR